MKITRNKTIVSSTLGVIFIFVSPSIPPTEGWLEHRVDDDSVIIEAREHIPSPTNYGSGVSSGTVSNDGWKEEFERRVAKCETLKISSGWDSDPDCIGITWEPDTTNQPNQPTPSAADIIYYATTHVQAQGSGLVVQPSTRALVSIPTLVHASSPTQTITTTETSPPFTVRKAHIILTDTADEQTGH